jgi:hypothetical protein
VTFGFDEPVTFAVNCMVVLMATVIDVGLIVTATAVIVTVELALLVVSALLVAVTVCVPVVDGAV